MARSASRERRSRLTSPARCLPGLAGRASKLLSPSSGSSSGRAAAPPVPRRAASPWRRLALLPVLALLLGVFSPFAAAPASAAVLVSNVGQSHSSNIDLENTEAQQFTTGSHAAGYSLSSIDIRFGTAVGTPANLRVELWSAKSDGTPDTGLKTLTTPSSVPAGTVSFAAPANTVLTASTNYFVVVSRTAATTGDLALTTSDDEDSGAATGWSIANTRHENLNLSWRTKVAALMIRVNVASSNANLSGLTAKSATSATGTFSALALSPSTFSASTTAYTASVANNITHVKLTPTKAHTGASIKVGKVLSLTAVNSGSESSAIALSEGSNAIKVEVTAQDGTTKRTYTVTVTRALPVPLSLTATTGTHSGGTPQLTLGASVPSGFTGNVVFQVKPVAGAWPARGNTHNRPTGVSEVSGRPQNTAVMYGFTPGASYDVRAHLARSVTLNIIGTVFLPVAASTSESRVTFPTSTQSTNANLSALTAKSATSGTGTFSALTLSPSTFSASTTA